MSRRYTIVTPENVEVTYDLAGLGSRFLAALIDYSIIAAILIVLALIALAVHSVFNIFAVGYTWGIAMAVFAVFAVEWLYFIVLETMWAGQTVGKRTVGLRVLREGGFPVNFRNILVRNVMRTMDFLPLTYAAGMIAILMSRNNKRLGDMAAGTVVVREKGERLPAPLRFGPFPHDIAALNLNDVTPNDIAVARRFLERAAEIDAATRLQMARQIARPILMRLGQSEASVGALAGEFLQALVVDWDRRMDLH